MKYIEVERNGRAATPVRFAAVNLNLKKGACPMGLFQRIGDIISANFNDMVDQFEDPEAMLKQAVREMETAIGEAKQEVVQTMASEKMVRKNRTDNERQVQEWQQRAEKAVLAGDEALARKALVRKEEYEKVAAALRD